MTNSSELPPVSLAVIVHNRAVLMIRRRKPEGTLLWALPGGAVEPGETVEQAAVREVAEEVGLTVTAERILGTRIHPTTRRTLTYTACTLATDDLSMKTAVDEVAETAWVRHDEIRTRVPGGLFEPVQIYLDTAIG